MCAILPLSACGGSPIVGKWKDEIMGKASMEFKSDGTLIISFLGQTKTAKYKVRR
jgi:hypothetical protein